MIDASAVAFLAIVAVLGIARIWQERRQADREIEDQRIRIFKGDL